ncbi:MAG: putative Zn-binding protein involved in type VI secretion [Arenicella sp.]|jgi:uncharacterized Zn-binding protein involved in type VI secretion
MNGVAVGELDAAVGMQLTQINAWHKVEGKPVVVIGDIVAAHAPFNGAHAPEPKMVEGSPWYRLNGIGVCVEGDAADCGDVTTGRSWYRVSA